MPAPTRDILWHRGAAILRRRTALTTQPSQLCVDSGTLTINMQGYGSKSEKQKRRKRLIFSKSKWPKKVQLPLPSFLKNWNQLEQLFYRQLYLQKMILKKLFFFCLITLVAPCQDIWKMPLIIAYLYPAWFIELMLLYRGKKRQDKSLTFE